LSMGCHRFFNSKERHDEVSRVALVNILLIRYYQ
jgi:hypothetical protein